MRFICDSSRGGGVGRGFECASSPRVITVNNRAAWSVQCSTLFRLIVESAEDEAIKIIIGIRLPGPYLSLLNRLSPFIDCCPAGATSPTDVYTYITLSRCFGIADAHFHIH